MPLRGSSAVHSTPCTVSSMKTFRSALVLVIAALIFVPALAEATALSDLTAATTTNTIDNGNNVQIWEWSTFTGGTNGAFSIVNSNNTSATQGQTLLYVSTAGTNTNSSITTRGAIFTNGHSGTGSTNYGAMGEAESGTVHNYGLYGHNIGTNAGDAGVWGNSDAGSGASYGVYGSNNSSTGYGGYFTNTGSGYALATGSGNVGIGTATPQSLVHAYGGEVQVGSSGASCAAARGGAIRFSGSSLYYCDGSSTWQTVSSGGGSGTVTSSSAGQVAYYQSTGTTVIGTSTLNISSGNVGIGTATPGALFTVGNNNFEVNSSGTVLAGTWNGSAISLSSYASGTLQAAQFPALTGDVTPSAGALATTVAKIQGKTVSGVTGTGNVVM